MVLVGGGLSQLAATDTLFTGRDLFVVSLASIQTVAGTTLADVAGLSATLKANATYYFEFDVQITQAAAIGIVGLGVNYTGTLTQIAYTANIAATSSTTAYRGTNTNNTALVDAAARAIAASLPARVAGTIVTTGAGVLSLRAQRSAGTTTILVGSGGLIAQA